MREALEARDGERASFTGTFVGTFVRLGKKNGHYGVEETVLLRDVADSTGQVVADHVWFTLTTGFARLLPLVEGERVEFCARVKPYLKGYRRWEDGGTLDYKLAWPTRVRRVPEASATNA